MTLILKCGNHTYIKPDFNRLVCVCPDAAFCPKEKDKLTLTLQCFTEKEPHATKPPFLKVK